MRFNDTLRLQLTNDETTVSVQLVKLAIEVAPVARTYHASCLVGKYMVISGGEATVLADLQDIWALDIES